MRLRLGVAAADRFAQRLEEILISRCRGSNPAAPTGQSVANAYGIGSRYQRTSHGVESNIQVYDEIPETSQRSPSAGDAVVHSAICCLAVSAVDREENRFPRE